MELPPGVQPWEYLSEPLSEKVLQAQGHRALTALGFEVDELSQFEHHMAGYGSRPDVQEAMRGYTDLVEGGHREIFRILPRG